MSALHYQPYPRAARFVCPEWVLTLACLVGFWGLVVYAVVKVVS